MDAGLSADAAQTRTEVFAQREATRTETVTDKALAL
jgi:hypothetical protein